MKAIMHLKGGEGSGNFGHSGRPGMVGGSDVGASIVPNGIKMRDTGPEARAEYDGSISINRGRWNEMSDRTRKGILAHEIVHHTVEDYILANNDRWNEAVDVLTLQINNRGDRLFLGGNTRIGEAISDAIGTYLTDKDLPYTTDKVWDWAKRSIESSGNSVVILQRRLNELYNQSMVQKQYTSAIIAFNLEGEKWLDDLAQPFGKDAISDFHVTLVWLGDASKLDKESVQTKIAGLAETYAPISGVFNGVAKFTDSGDGVPVVLTFDSPALPGFRQALREAFPDVEQNHGFTAHTTLAYTTNDIVNNNPVTLDKPIEHIFNSIWLFWAGERYEYPLVGNVVTKGGKGSGNFGHSGRPGFVGGSSEESHINTPDIDLPVSRASVESGVYKYVTLINSKGYHTFASDQGNPLEYDEFGGIDAYISMRGDSHAVENALHSNGFDENDTKVIGNGLILKYHSTYDGFSIRVTTKDRMTLSEWRNARKFGFDYWMSILPNNTVTKQLPIDDASKNNLIEVRVNIFNDDVTALAERLYTGDVSLNAWEEAMRKYIRELHTSIAAIGKGGWDNMTWEDWGRLGPILKNQYQYLHGFAEYIAANRETITLAQLQARAKYYGESAKQTAGFIITPIAIEKQLPWMPRMGNGNIGMEDGDGTECRFHCCCGWILKIVSKEGDFNIVDATWTLSPAEHCDTCIERDGYTVTIRVYKDIPVPESIGFYCD